jgi:hypothetical protein
MDGKPLLWFALGIVFTVSIGATVMRNDGIEFPDGSVQTTAAVGGERSYYLTNFAADGASALAACDTGYHMASLFEIVDPSNLRYAFNHADAATQADSGVGPPADLFGWVRTGEAASGAGEMDEGEANCGVWTSNDPGLNGTRVEIEDKWADIPLEAEIGPWDVDLQGCDDPDPQIPTGVWCVED